MMLRRTLCLIGAATALFITMTLTASESVEEAIVRRDRELNALISSNNSAEAASYYVDSFVLTTSAGTRKSKPDMLREIGNPTLTFEVNETSDIKVNVFGDTAVLLGTLHQRGSINGKSFEARMLVTDTWVKVEDEWLIAAGHASVIP